MRPYLASPVGEHMCVCVCDGLLRKEVAHWVLSWASCVQPPPPPHTRTVEQHCCCNCVSGPTVALLAVPHLQGCLWAAVGAGAGLGRVCFWSAAATVGSGVPAQVGLSLLKASLIKLEFEKVPGCRNLQFHLQACISFAGD